MDLHRVQSVVSPGAKASASRRAPHRLLVKEDSRMPTFGPGVVGQLHQFPGESKRTRIGPWK